MDGLRAIAARRGAGAALTAVTSMRPMVTCTGGSESAGSSAGAEISLRLGPLSSRRGGAAITVTRSAVNRPGCALGASNPWEADVSDRAGNESPCAGLNWRGEDMSVLAGQQALAQPSGATSAPTFPTESDETGSSPVLAAQRCAGFATRAGSSMLGTARITLCPEFGLASSDGTSVICRETDNSAGIAGFAGAYQSATRGSTDAICPSCRCAKRVRKSLMTAPSPSTNLGALRSCQGFLFHANDKPAPAHRLPARAGAPARESPSREPD